MIGILTEKPSAGRNFATALGGMSGTYQGEAYTIVSARGHLYEYAMPSEQVASQYQEQYKSWDMRYLPWDERLFQWKREKKKGTSDMLSNIRKVLSGCNEVVIATDVDPTGEGELLAWEILDELNIRNKKFTRMYFTDESEKELQKAFVNRKPLPSMQQDMDYVKAEFRSQWDMLSMQFTRIATACVSNKAVLRQGRLKSAMVQIVGDGLKAVKAYKRVPFYSNKFRDENGVVYTNPDEPRYPKESEVPQTYQPSPVVKDSAVMKQTAPPKLLDLADLSARLSSQGYKAKDVLAVYQKMYEAKVVSYPRTEDKVITPEQFNDLLPQVDAIANVVGVDRSLLTHRTPRKTHVKTGGAHGANRPGPNVPRDLASLRQYGDCAPLIYEILAKNYLAMLSEDYEYEYQKGHIAQYPKFVGTVSVPKKMGWKQVFDVDADAGEDENGIGLGTLGTPFIGEGVNPKPPTPTMKWLMKQLERYDVGTGATRTSTYADVTSDSSKYPLLLDAKGKITMTPFGDMSYVLLKDTKIGDVKTTELLQMQMKEIAAGKLQAAECLHQIQDFVKHDMDVMQKNAVALRKEIAGMASKNGYVQKEKYSGTWRGKQISFTRVWSEYRFTDDECERLLAGEDVEVHGLISKTNGTKYDVVGHLEEQTFNGHTFVGYMRTGFAGGNKGGFPTKWAEHVFTEDERILLESGKTVFIKGCVSKKGRHFDVNVQYHEKSGETRKSIIPEYDKENFIV